MVSTDLAPSRSSRCCAKGSVLVIEEAPDADVGSIGSNNIMGWMLRGCVGVVTSATARHTKSHSSVCHSTSASRARYLPRTQRNRVG